MNNRQRYGARFAALVAGLGLVAVWIPAAVATSYTWDVNGAASGTGGTGTWDTTTLNWNAVAAIWLAIPDVRHAERRLDVQENR